MRAMRLPPEDKLAAANCSGFRVRAGNYTAFMYLEDDLVVPWPVMQAWAEDTELLQVRVDGSAPGYGVVAAATEGASVQ